jgi:ferredoxin
MESVTGRKTKSISVSEIYRAVLATRPTCEACRAAPSRQVLGAKRQKSRARLTPGEFWALCLDCEEQERAQRRVRLRPAACTGCERCGGAPVWLGRPANPDWVRPHGVWEKAALCDDCEARFAPGKGRGACVTCHRSGASQ